MATVPPAMARRFKSSDVFDPNAVTRVELEARVLGRFRPTGPNKWDDFELQRTAEGEVLEVKAEEKIQVEPLGAAAEVRFRLRERREVVLLRWLPTEEDDEALASGKWGIRESEQATTLEKVFGLGPKDDPRDDMLEYFLDVKSEPFHHEDGLGALAILVPKLKARS